MRAAFRRYDVCRRHLARGKATFQVRIPHTLLEFLVMLGIMLCVTNEVASQAEDPAFQKIESEIIHVSGKTVTIDMSKWNFLPAPGTAVTIQQTAEIPLMGEWRVTKLSENSVLAEPVPDKRSGQPAVGWRVNINALKIMTKRKEEVALWLSQVKGYRSTAEAGDAGAQLLLGTGYRELGDYSNSHLWFEKAAEQGEAGGFYYLGELQEKKGNDAEAERLYREAVKRSDDSSESPSLYHMMAVDSLYGNYRAREGKAKADAWLREAAAMGSRYAQERLEQVGTE